MPAKTHGTGSSQRMSSPVDHVALDQRPDHDQAEEGDAHHQVADVDGVAPGLRRACSCWSWSCSSVVTLDLADAQLGVDGDVGGVGAAVVRAGQVDVDAAVRASPNSVDVAGAVDVGVDRRRPRRRGRSPRSGRRRRRRSMVRPSRSSRSATSVRSSDQLAGAEVVAVLRPRPRSRRPCASVAVPPVGGGRAGQAEAGEQAEQDQPAGAAEERADQQHHAGDRRRPGRGTPSRRRRRRPASTMPRTPTPSAISASVNQNRIGPRLRGFARRAAALAARRRRRVGYGGRGVRRVGRAGSARPLRRVRRGRGRRRGRTPRPAAVPAVVAGQQPERDQRDDRQRPGEPEGRPTSRRPARARRSRRRRSARRCGCARRGGPAASPVSVLGHQQPAGAVQDQAGAAEEGEHHERDPQDERVDVEVAGQAAGDAGDLAVGRGAAQPAEVADLVAGDARAVVVRWGPAGGPDGASGGVVVMAPSLRRRRRSGPSGTTLILPGPRPARGSGSGRGCSSWSGARPLCDD